jgi:urease subunit alpha
VPREPAPVLVDDVPTGTDAVTELPLAQLHHFA